MTATATPVRITATRLNKTLRIAGYHNRTAGERNRGVPRCMGETPMLHLDGRIRVSIMADKTSIAVLGLGIMGTGMATRLISHGFAVTVFNRSRNKTEPLAKLGAKVA